MEKKKKQCAEGRKPASRGKRLWIWTLGGKNRNRGENELLEKNPILDEIGIGKVISLEKGLDRKRKKRRKKN